jgi:hypothetical protein
MVYFKILQRVFFIPFLFSWLGLSLMKATFSGLLVLNEIWAETVNSLKDQLKLPNNLVKGWTLKKLKLHLQKCEQFKMARGIRHCLELWDRCFCKSKTTTENCQDCLGMSKHAESQILTDRSLNAVKSYPRQRPQCSWGSWQFKTVLKCQDHNKLSSTVPTCRIAHARDQLVEHLCQT